MGDFNRKTNMLETTFSIIKKILDILSWIWIAFWVLFIMVIIFASNNRGAQIVTAFLFSIIASIPAIIYILKRRKSKKNIGAQSDLIIENEILRKDSESKLSNKEGVLERNKNIFKSLLSLKYLKKKTNVIFVAIGIIGLIAVFSYTSFIGILRSVEVTSITINKDTVDRDGRVKLDVNIKGLGNYFIEQAYVYKKEDWDKRENTRVSAYNLTAITGRSVWFNSKNLEVDTSLDKDLYSAVNNSKSGSKYVLVVKSRINQVVSNTFTLSKQVTDDLRLAEQLQKKKSEEAARKKEIDDKKASEEAMAKQKENDLLTEQTEKNRFVKVSSKDNTETWRVYVEAGKSLRIYGDAGNQLVIIIGDESGNPLVSDMLWEGAYDRSYTLNERYNGYYNVEFSYISNYKYNCKFQVK
ncbi:hypothetical protein [Clostridium sp. C8-1-8]|uniref:hypothetical protein n=1 Tax=Clostridium sp. C8-1-8 TaxID=2698831 RepID=UPI0013708AEC|nr:hypothetical protein [Clostridium sp. C8-1-8]